MLHFDTDASIKTENDDGLTPLHLAAQSSGSNKDVVERLVNHDDVNVREIL